MNKETLLNTKVENLSDKFEMEKLLKLNNIYIASQPEHTDWEKLKAMGFKNIINLRSPEDTPADEIDTLNSLGMSYLNVPVPSCHVLTLDQIRKVNECIGDTEGEKTLIHCKSGNRASSWLAVHLFFQHNFTPEQAVKKAQEVALTMPGITEETKEYLESLAKS